MLVERMRGMGGTVRKAKFCVLGMARGNACTVVQGDPITWCQL